MRILEPYSIRKARMCVPRPNRGRVACLHAAQPRVGMDERGDSACLPDAAHRESMPPRRRWLQSPVLGAIVSLCVLYLAGCGRPEGEIFTLINPVLVWPLPPEKPRIKCLGEIRSTADLRPAKTGWQVLRERLHPQESRPLRLTKPHAVAVGSDDRIYVVDSGSGSLHVIDLGRRTHRIVDSAGDQRLSSPVGVAVGPSSVFVTDAVLADIIEYTLEGEYVGRLGIQFERPAGIVYCPANDRLYVVDTTAHHCVVLARNGEGGSGWTVAGAFGERGTAPGRFNFPTHITYHRLLGLVVSDTLNFRVQRFELDGTFRASIGKKGDGAGDFSLPKGVAVDRDGHLYVVDAHFENVQVFREDGRLLTAFGAEGAELGAFSVPSGIAIDAADRIWIADSYNRRLQVFQYISES